MTRYTHTIDVDRVVVMNVDLSASGADRFRLLLGARLQCVLEGGGVAAEDFEKVSDAAIRSGELQFADRLANRLAGALQIPE